MSRTDQIRQIIAQQRGRGEFSIEDFIRVRGRNNSEQEIEEAVDYCRVIIGSVPLIFDQIRAVAAERGFSNWVEPLVAQAEDYFLDGDDLLPESTYGEFGLLDDAYVALKVVSLIDSDPPMLEVSVDDPLNFLQQILGDESTGMLEAEVDKARARMHARMKQIQEAAQRQAEAQLQNSRERSQAATQPSPPSRPSPAPDRQQCGACSGSGRVTCSSCYGQGSHTQSYSRVDWEGNAEYVTENIPCGCAGGYTTCGSCGGSGWK